MAEVERYTVIIGSNCFINTPCALGMRRNDGTIVPLLHARIRPSDLQLQFSFEAEDDAGAKIRVRNNVPVGADTERFEVHHLANQKLVKNRITGHTFLDIRNTGLLSGGNIEIYGDFFFEGMHILATENGIDVHGNQLAGNRMENCGGILLSPREFVLGFGGEIPPFPPL